MPSEGNSEWEFVFSLPIDLQKKYAIIYETLKCLLFVVTNLTANFFGFLLLPYNVYAYVMDSL